MKKSYTKLLFFNILLIIALFLNSFIKSILSSIWILSLFLLLLIILFKFLFGIEKDNHRFIKDIMFNIIIIYLTSFIIYYLFGLIIGFVKTQMHYSIYGFLTFILPYIIMITLKEFLRYQILTKSGKSKLLVIVNIILFTIFDITNNMNIASFNDKYTIFMLFALYLLPAISNNIVATYITKKVGYKPNILWLSIAGLYYSLLPIVPNTGAYVGAMIKFLFPIVIMYNVYSFFQKREKNIPLRDNKKNRSLSAITLSLFVAILVYFTSGYFRYQAIAIATGSMTPNILKGDVVIIDKEINPAELKLGQVIAYKYESRIIVHRLVDKVKVGNEYFLYTKGDANNGIDNYIIYEKMLVGKVDIKIPYIGNPTVWLNEL